LVINRVDEVAYHHDLCYAKHGDTKTRNELCDKSMLQDLSNIYNQSLREKNEIGLVSKLINSKVNRKKAPIKASIKWTDSSWKNYTNW